MFRSDGVLIHWRVICTVSLEHFIFRKAGIWFDREGDNVAPIPSIFWLSEANLFCGPDERPCEEKVREDWGRLLEKGLFGLSFRFTWNDKDQ